MGEHHQGGHTAQAVEHHRTASGRRGVRPVDGAMSDGRRSSTARPIDALSPVPLAGCNAVPIAGA